jgi:hypothetical protein
MTGRLLRFRHPRRGVKIALIAVLILGLLVGCGTFEKSRNWLDVATDVCNILDKIQKYCHVSK